MPANQGQADNMDFDVIPVSTSPPCHHYYQCRLALQYEDIVWGQRLGAGSFGSVYKGELSQSPPFVVLGP